MGFQPGHKINEGRKLERGATGERRRALRSLAMHLRENPLMDKLIANLWTMAVEGRNPITNEPVDDKGQREAAKMILERAFGQPAQHVVLEGHVRNEVLAIAPRDDRPQLTLDEINERRRKLRDAGIKPKVIEAEAKPVLELPEADDA